MPAFRSLVAQVRADGSTEVPAQTFREAAFSVQATARGAKPVLASVAISQTAETLNLIARRLEADDHSGVREAVRGFERADAAVKQECD